MGNKNLESEGQPSCLDSGTEPLKAVKALALASLATWQRAHHGNPAESGWSGSGDLHYWDLDPTRLQDILIR